MTFFSITDILFSVGLLCAPPKFKIRRMIRGFGKMQKNQSDISDIEINDIYLIKEIKNGNSDAFKVLAERYNYIISYNLSKLYSSFSFAAFSRIESEREDLFQECRIILYKAAKYYDFMKNVKFSTYANICVKNYLVSLRREYGGNKNQRDFVSFVSLDEIIGNEPGRYDRYFALNDCNSFFETLEDYYCPLSVFEKAVLMMYIENKSYKCIARLMNKSVKSIDNAICRIKSKLKPYAEHFVSEY